MDSAAALRHPLQIVGPVFVFKIGLKFSELFNSWLMVGKLLLTVGEILTQGLPPLPEPLSTQDFYLGYQERLENKMRQKNRQISRTKRLLETLPKEQRPTFQAILDEEMRQFTDIKNELDELFQLLSNPDQVE